MDKYIFLVEKSSQEFISISKHDNDIHVGANLDLYSALLCDEETARLSFTATGHLPSDKFEELLNLANGIEEVVVEEVTEESIEELPLDEEYDDYIEI